MSNRHPDFDIAACRASLLARQAARLEERETRRAAARTAALATIQAILPRYPAVQRLYLFGSVTQPGMFHAESDIDIAVEGVNAEQYFDLWRDLNEAAPEWAFDVRDIGKPSDFADTVRQRGELVYERKNDPAEERHRKG